MSTGGGAAGIGDDISGTTEDTAGTTEDTAGTAEDTPGPTEDTAGTGTTADTGTTAGTGATAGIGPRVIHTPGHTWGSRPLHAPFLNAVFTDGTLVHGGPGATERSCSDRAALEASLRSRLLTLPGGTVVHTGHGRDTTTAAERPYVPAPRPATPARP
ncbi:MBL fold metallo-hydrolase [Streptomyces sp. NPDC006134]|uniref:MBL fold metallo-hydrolase n=1 Tax=Streptomyces sp. NPDC006134 TaxID=3154467 RepID=UPI0033E05D6C